MRAGRNRWLIGGMAAAIVAIGVAAFLLLQVFGGATPAAVSLDPSGGTFNSGGGGNGASPAATPSISFDGTWSIDTTSGSFSTFTDSFAGYRIREQLGTIGAHTAVGRTPNVDGSMTIAGTSITAVKVTVDMTTLKSDDDRRDGQLRMRGLETDQFPTATFTLTKPIDIGSAPAQGKTIKATAVGDLTLHGMTKSVQIPIQAQWTGSRIEVVGSYDLALADYDITPPTGFLVLSIADHGTIELHLLFAKS